jgi:CRISPR-associated endoribonuclease Cas6
MRTRLVFRLKNKGACVPFHHQHLLTKFLAEIRKDSPEQWKNFNFYHFSGLKGQTKVSRNGLHFYSSRITWVLSSKNVEFITHIVQKIFTYPSCLVGQLELVPEMVEKENAPQFTNEVKYICISPLVISEGQGNSYVAKKFVLPETDQFSDLLYESTLNRMEQSKGFSIENLSNFFKFQLIPDQNYLHKIKQDQKKFARIYTLPEFQNSEVRGYTFPFTLCAMPEVQEFVFENGLGVHTTQGYGMIDLANTDPVERVEVFEF